MTSKQALAAQRLSNLSANISSNMPSATRFDKVPLAPPDAILGNLSLF